MSYLVCSIALSHMDSKSPRGMTWQILVEIWAVNLASQIEEATLNNKVDSNRRIQIPHQFIFTYQCVFATL